MTSHIPLDLTVALRAETTDLKKRLDRATYCFRIQVFEAIGAILVGPNLLLIGEI